jgi:hypothetical protein
LDRVVGRGGNAEAVEVRGGRLALVRGDPTPAVRVLKARGCVVVLRLGSSRDSLRCELLLLGLPKLRFDRRHERLVVCQPSGSLVPSERFAIVAHVRQRLDAGVEPLASCLQLVDAETQLRNVLIREGDLPQHGELAIDELRVAPVGRNQCRRRASSVLLCFERASSFGLIGRVE